jgi:hypothetical protein
VIGCGEQAGERRDGFEQQRVDASLLIGGMAGAELGDGAVVFGVGGELAQAGGDRGAGGGGWLPGRSPGGGLRAGTWRPGRGMIRPSSRPSLTPATSSAPARPATAPAAPSSAPSRSP